MNELSIVAVNIKEQYTLISHFMDLLHQNEYLFSDKTARWSDIEKNYMSHVIEMQKECDGLCLVAYVGGEPAGFVFGYLSEQDDSRIEVYQGKELYVSDGFMEEKFRRMGIYEQMNQQLEQHYIDQGIRKMTRFTHVKNDGMRRLLEKNGYDVTRLLFEKWLD